MSELTIAVSVDGIEASAWAPAFRDAMAQAADGIDVAVDGVAVDGVGAGVGTLGTRRGSGVKLTASQGGEGDALLKLVGLVLAALSVAIGATQLGLNLKGHAAREPARPTFVCTIEGPGGQRELRIEGATMPSDAVLRECLRYTGVPSEINAAPHGPSHIKAAPRGPQ